MKRRIEAVELDKEDRAPRERVPYSGSVCCEVKTSAVLRLFSERQFC